MLKSLANEGQYLEYHPRFNPRKDLNLGKNLQQAILYFFDDEVIDQMVADKKINTKPIFDSKYQSFKAWTRDTFNYLKTKISVKLGYPIVTVVEAKQVNEDLSKE